MRIKPFVIVAICVVTLMGAAGSAHADLCFQANNGVRYQLQIGVANAGAGTPIVVTGTRVIATFRTPVSGSLIVLPTKIVIGLTEVFDFGSGSFTHPNGTTSIFLPTPSPPGPTFDTTFHGNGAPHNVTGGISTIACPLADTADDDRPDPNGR